MRDQIVDQGRHLRTHGFHPDPFEKAAFGHGRFHRLGDSGQGGRSAALQVKIDGHQILARMMAQDIAGRGDHRIALGQGGHDIRLKRDAGIPICAHTARRMGVHDHPGIVWDEIVGYLVTMTFAPQGWLWVAAGFVLFRVFDIAKPWPIRLLDRNVGGGFGIMVDDLLAGIFAAVVLQLLVFYSI